MKEFHDSFTEGNELIENAIEQYHVSRDKEHLLAVLDTIRIRMHEDGHFIFPVLKEDEETFAFRTVQTSDAKIWTAAFTSQEEYEKGESSQVISNFIDSTMKMCLESGTDGFIINPWGKFFFLTKEMMAMIFDADGGEEYIVPDPDPIKEDGAFLKKAIAICNHHRTETNLIRLAKILRDSWIWIPCNAVMSDTDYEAMEKTVLAAMEKEDPDSLVGQTFVTQDEVRMVPDILENGGEFFFPVFTSEEEMGEYGTHFSTIEKHFLEAISLAENNERKISGIVINAFTEPFVIPMGIFSLIEQMPSSKEEEE